MKNAPALTKTNGGKVAQSAKKIDPQAAQQAQQRMADPIASVDSLRQDVMRIGQRTDGLAQQDAQFLANQESFYLQQLNQHMGTAEVVPVDGFRQWIDSVCSGSVCAAAPVGVGAIEPDDRADND